MIVILATRVDILGRLVDNPTVVTIGELLPDLQDDIDHPTLPVIIGIILTTDLILEIVILILVVVLVLETAVLLVIVKVTILIPLPGNVTTITRIFIREGRQHS